MTANGEGGDLVTGGIWRDGRGGGRSGQRGGQGKEGGSDGGRKAEGVGENM